nr:hypothetical protein CFP56_44861 [Quercus suber]
MTATAVRFTSMPMWVQVWGLAFDLLLEEVGRDIGSGLGEVLEVDLKEFLFDQARFIRVRVELLLINHYVEEELSPVLKEIRFVLVSSTND